MLGTTGVGTECCINYGPRELIDWPVEKRQQYTLRELGFVCSCTRCVRETQTGGDGAAAKEAISGGAVEGTSGGAEAVAEESISGDGAVAEEGTSGDGAAKEGSGGDVGTVTKEGSSGGVGTVAKNTSAVDSDTAAANSDGRKLRVAAEAKQTENVTLSAEEAQSTAAEEAQATAAEEAQSTAEEASTPAAAPAEDSAAGEAPARAADEQQTSSSPHILTAEQSKENNQPDNAQPEVAADAPNRAAARGDVAKLDNKLSELEAQLEAARIDAMNDSLNDGNQPVETPVESSIQVADDSADILFATMAISWGDKDRVLPVQLPIDFELWSKERWLSWWKHFRSDKLDEHGLRFGGQDVSVMVYKMAYWEVMREISQNHYENPAEGIFELVVGMARRPEVCKLLEYD